jgi:hypothetical protein
MNARGIAYGLGWFSIGLGLAEIFASRRIARSLDAESHRRLIQGFGLREIVAGIGLLQAPAHSARTWNRVAGDGMDLVALGAAARKSPRNAFVWGSLAFVVAATVADVLTARALDRETGETLPMTA